MRHRIDRRVARRLLGAGVLLCVCMPPAAQQASSGQIRAMPGPCQARDSTEGPWRDLAVGGALVAGTTIICQQAGALSYTLPGSGANVTRHVQIGEEVVVTKGRQAPMPVEGTRPGLSASLQSSPPATGNKRMAALPGISSPVHASASVGVAIGALAGAVLQGLTKGSGAMLGATSDSTTDITSYLTRLRKASAGDDTRVTLRVMEDARRTNESLDQLKQVAATWLEAGPPPAGSSSDELTPAAAARWTREDLVELMERIGSARRVAESYEEAASWLSVTAKQRGPLDTELGRLRVGIRQLDTTATELMRREARERRPAPAASAAP